MPTIAQIVRDSGRRTVVAGTKPVALLLDRQMRDARSAENGPNLFQGQCRPSSLLDDIQNRFGPLPPQADPKLLANGRQDNWTTRVLVQRLWAQEVPAFTMLWLSEPDFAQHGSGPGSKVARSALKSSDEDLAMVLEALDAAKVRDKTDVLVVSDHGFSTISRNVELPDELKKAGLKVVRGFAAEPVPGEIVLVGNGGSVFFHVVGHDEAVIRRLVEALQTSDYAGAIFTRKPIAGAFSLEQAGIDTPDAPDVVLGMRWSDETSATGLPGTLVSESNKLIHGQGNHASLSRYDMHNTLIAAGADFRAGMVDQLPSGNVNLAPTVLWILNIKPAGAMDGRVLAEAMPDAPASTDQPQSTTLEAETSFGELTWKQYLKVTHLGATTYYDEGNGSVRLRK